MSAVATGSSDAAAPSPSEPSPSEELHKEVSPPESGPEGGEKPVNTTTGASVQDDAASKSERPASPSPVAGRKSGRGSTLPLWLMLFVVLAVISLLWVPNPWQSEARHTLVLLQGWWQPAAAGPDAEVPSVPSSPPPAEADDAVADKGTSDTARERPRQSSPSDTEMVETASPVTASPVSEEPVIEMMHRSETPAVAPSAQSKESADQPPSDSVRLNRQIAQLHQQLQQVTSSQQQLVQQQQAMTSNALRQQIALLRTSQGGLPQMAQAWQSMSQLPGLRPQLRQQAQAIASEAARLLAQRKQWQQLLRQAAKAMWQAPDHHRVSLADISAVADFPLTRWLDQQFVLYRLPDGDQQRKNRVARELQRIAAAMERGAWPTAERWLRSRQQISYWLDPVRVEALPRNFEGVRQQLQALRQQQSRWLEEVQ